METVGHVAQREPWNKGKIIGAKGAVQTQGHLGAARQTPD